MTRLIAPNVPKAIRAYSDPKLARLLRHGVRPDGRGVAVKPSAMLYNLDDTDLGALIAYLRTIPVKDSAALPSTFMSPLARLGLTLGQYKLEPAAIAHDAPRPPNGPDAVARGQYSAMTSCVEYHGQRLEGKMGSPALAIVAGYTAAEFNRLPREGVPRDGRKLDWVSVLHVRRPEHSIRAISRVCAIIVHVRLYRIGTASCGARAAFRSARAGVL